MKYHQLFFWGFLGFFLISETFEANFHGEHELSTDTERDLYQASKFKCPFPFGNFPDAEDCSHYYSCITGMAFHRKCKKFTKFDKWRRTCLPSIIAICEKDGDKDESTPSDTTTAPTIMPTTKDSFVCPSFTGNFPHPNDCSKYYSCMFYLVTTKTCPKNELFDAIKKKCQPEKNVHCGDRPKLGFITTSIPTETTENTPTATETETTPIATETETTPIATETEIISTTTETITESITDTDPFTNVDTTTDATNEDITTTMTTSEPTAPPHDCNEEDDDCIIKETGDPKDWFKCPRAVGSFPHPSSDKLFIFCMNWIPSAKKCGLDRIYSREMSTCVDKYIL